ncbi:SirB2 family protein [Teredinibacter franksiae]|uniref:SirB2 family protein n=1 Tax=Teredinibacter franksiae TaxID=2761453 RepID=UPI0016293E45
MISAVKHFHVWFAIFSLAGFVIRVIWLTSRPDLLQRKAIKVLPHINDTALFATGLLMAFSMGYPFTGFYWLTAKLGLIILYILLGFMTLKQTSNSLYRFALLGVSFITYSSIIFLAVSKPHF